MDYRGSLGDPSEADKDVDVRYVVDSVSEEKGTKRIIARHSHQVMY